MLTRAVHSPALTPDGGPGPRKQPATLFMESDMDILEALDVIAELPTQPEMAKKCAKEIRRLKRLVNELERSNIALEALRPVWAQGWSSDSQAAQASAAALSEIWGFLDVLNQTDAMESLKNLVEKA